MRYKVPLSTELERLLTFQSYEPAYQREGIWHQPLRKHRSDNEWFMEHLRVTEETVEGMISYHLRQVPVSGAAPDSINTFHIHPMEGQNDRPKLVLGRFLVWLVDCRSGLWEENRG